MVLALRCKRRIRLQVDGYDFINEVKVEIRSKKKVEMGGRNKVRKEAQV